MFGKHCSTNSDQHAVRFASHRVFIKVLSVSFIVSPSTTGVSYRALSSTGKFHDSCCARGHGKIYFSLHIVNSLLDVVVPKCIAWFFGWGVGEAFYGAAGPVSISFTARVRFGTRRRWVIKLQALLYKLQIRFR